MRCVAKSLAVCGILTLFLCGASKLLADENESLESLRAEKLKAAQEWWDMLMIKVRVATADPAGADAFRAAKALRDAQIDVAMTKQDRVKA
jgi:hypothetical protein